MALRKYWLRTENQSPIRLNQSTMSLNNTMPIAAHTPEYNDDTLMQVRVSVRFTVRLILGPSGRLTSDFLPAFFPIIGAGYTGPGDTPPMNLRNPQDERIACTGDLRRDTLDYLESWGSDGQAIWAAGYSNAEILFGHRNAKGTPDTNVQAQAVIQVNQGYAFEQGLASYPLQYLIYVYFRSFWGSTHGAVGETH